MSFPLIIGLNLSPASGRGSFDAVEFVDGDSLETGSTELPGWFITATMMPPTVVINAVAIPPYTPSLAPDTVLPGFKPWMVLGEP